MAITATGIGSGLDINSLVTQLMSAESAPLDQLKAKQSSFNAKLSAFGTLQGAISSFQTALKAVSGTALAALTATSSKTDVLGVTTASGSGATAGSYAIEVSQLAQRDKLASAAVTPGQTFDASVTGTAMTITVGGKATPIPLSGTFTLASLAGAINNANAGVSATIVNDGKDDHLVVTGKDSGDANLVQIAASGSVAMFDTVTATPTTTPPTTMTWQQHAQNALLKIDGLDVSKPSNTITDAIKGVTLNLAQTNVGSPATVTLAQDATTVKGAITGMVDAYNSLNKTITRLTAYDATSKTGGVLNGDSSARAILSQLRAELGKAVGTSGSLTSLNDIGIAFQRDGTLSLEKPAKLQKALDTNFDNLGKLFSSDSGYATRLTALTTDMLGSRGVIQTRQNGIKDTLKNLSASQVNLQERLDQTEKRYRAQFNALDTMMSQMKSTSNFLTQQLSNLSYSNG
jgi:flagellar hook-associated protein 2